MERVEKDRPVERAGRVGRWVQARAERTNRPRCAPPRAPLLLRRRPPHRQRGRAGWEGMGTRAGSALTEGGRKGRKGGRQGRERRRDTEEKRGRHGCGCDGCCGALELVRIRRSNGVPGEGVWRGRGNWGRGGVCGCEYGVKRMVCVYVCMADRRVGERVYVWLKQRDYYGNILLHQMICTGRGGGGYEQHSPSTCSSKPVTDTEGTF